MDVTNAALEVDRFLRENPSSDDLKKILKVIPKGALESAIQNLLITVSFRERNTRIMNDYYQGEVDSFLEQWGEFNE